MPRGGVRPGAGRPVGTTKTVHKDECIYVRCTSENKKKIVAAAEASGLSIGEYMVRVCLNQL